MQDMPDKNLDKLFQKLAEERPVEFNPEAWQRMEKKLAEADRKKMWYKRLLILCMALTLLPITYFTVNYFSGDKVNQISSTSEKVGPIINSRVKETQSNTNSSGKANTEKALTPTGKSNKEANGEKTKEGGEQLPGAKDKKETAITHQEESNSQGKKEVKPEGEFEWSKESGTKKGPELFPAAKQKMAYTQKKHKKSKQNQLSERKSAPQEKVIDSDIDHKESSIENKETVAVNKGLMKQKLSDNDKKSGISPIQESNKMPEERPEDGEAFGKRSIKYLSGRSIVFLPGVKPELSTKAGEGLRLAASSDSIPLAKKRKATIPTGFTIGFAFSPDFSSIGNMVFFKPGTNTGISLEYRISRRISISTGLIYANKIYQTSNWRAYKPYPGYWATYPTPDRIDGACQVIDIPVNVRVNLLNKERYSSFVSTGLSTYLMRKESYDYVYGYNQVYTRKIFRENNHLFGVYNLSVGYERLLGKRFSIQAEPFVKVPISKIGFGNVKLLSSGIFFTAKYRFNTR